MINVLIIYAFATLISLWSTPYKWSIVSNESKVKNFAFSVNNNGYGTAAGIAIQNEFAYTKTPIDRRYGHFTISEVKQG